MHELSIAQNIVEIINQHVPEEDLHRVRSIFTTVGEHSGVVADSLSFSYQAITSSTLLELSHLEIERIPYIIRCSGCGNKSPMEIGNRLCPACGGMETEIVSGLELHVREIELQDT